MTKLFPFFSLTMICATTLLGQSTEKQTPQAGTVTQTVKQTAATAQPATSNQPAILNVLTVIGDNVLGVPCLDCLLNILVPTLGLPRPVGQAFRGSNYQIDTYLIDNTYSGPCTFTFTLRDSNSNVIVSKRQTLNETANSTILLSTPVNIPSTAGIGLGTVSTTAVCGSSKTESQSPVAIACVTNPPYCVE